MYGKREMDSAVATMTGEQVSLLREHANAECVEVESVFIVRISLTAFSSQIGVGRLIYGKEKDGGAVTAVHVGSGQRVNAGSGGCRNVESVLVEIIAQTYFSSDGVALFGVDRQVQGDDAVTTMRGWERVDISAGLCERHSLETIALIVANRFVESFVLDRMHS